MDTKELFIILPIVGLGLTLFIIGIILFILKKRKQKNCISLVDGQVVGYRFYHEAPEPIVEYVIDGVKYKKAKCFKAVIISTRGGLSLKNLNPNDYEIYVDEKDIIHIKRSAIFNMKRAAQELYPIGSTLKVFYNPNKPKQAYVDRIPEGNSIVGIVFIGCGVFIIILGIIIYLLIK